MAKGGNVFDRAASIGENISPFAFAFGAIVAMFFIFVAAKGELGTYIAFFTFAAPSGTPAPLIPGVTTGGVPGELNSGTPGQFNLPFGG